jgi:hypothetical protein
MSVKGSIPVVAVNGRVCKQIQAILPEWGHSRLCTSVTIKLAE